MNRYRVKKNVIRETITEREIETYYTIEKCRKKYFIFGPDIWVDYCEKHKKYIDWGEYIWVNEIKIFYNSKEAFLFCKRLNEGLSTTYNDSVIMEIKL